MYFVYLLTSSDNATYVGATVDLNRRLRQHNKEITGGAHATSIKVGKGESWTRACHVAGFPTWQAALQFEWRWKQLSRKEPHIKTALKRRLNALKKLLELEKSTSNATPYKDWVLAPEIHFETERAREWYKEGS